MKKKNPWLIPTIILLVFSILLTAAIPVTAYYETMINAALNAQTQKIIPGENSKIFYWTDYESEEDLVNNDMAVCRQVEAEGAALLLNKNNARPLAADAKMSLFSQSASDPVLTGTGSAFMATGDAVSLYAALQDSFAPGCVNQELWKFYKTSGYKRVNAALSGGSPDQYRINEVPWEKYPEALKATFPQYGDAAIVVLSRSSGEGADLPNSLEGLRDYMTDGDYLQLCAEERALLDNLMQLKQDGVFKKVIVIFNSSSTLQLDFIDDYDIDALLWVGNLGLNGIPAVADILAGKVNPSGRIVDTFQKDNHAAPSMQNYDGSGLSYTTFDYSDFKITDQGSTILAEVDVTNTGKVDGKHTVQIYFQSPYTQYDIDNGVEKAAVELCGFDKKEIAAGKTEHFAIEIRKDDLTSYDSNLAKTYIMDAGDYYFTVASDAHNAVNNILVAKGADTARMSGTGDAALTATWTLDELDSTTYSVSAYTGNAITNLFEDADLNKYAGAEGQTVTYLCRNDWQGTFPTTQSLRVTDAMWADGLTHNAEERTAIVEKMKTLYWQGATLPESGTGGALKAIDFVETRYEDSAWDKLVSQISYGDMLNTIYNGAYNTHALPAINLPATMEADGPTGYTKSLMGGSSGMAFTSEDVIAASYSRELAYLVGKCMAEDMLHSNQNSDSTSVAGIYAPGLNIHRSQYLGRHNEYYSEDGWLSGEIAASQVQGIRSKGVLAFAKHFALNDQEQGRYGISVWANEQSIREVYLEAFEGAIRGGAMNVMTSFNRIGVVWSGAHYGLMTGILRDEWGMEGAAITDMSMNAKWMDYRMGLLAGQDIWCGQKGSMGTLDGSENDPAIASAVHRAMKNIVYSVTRTNAMNVGDAVVLTVTPTWKIALYALTGAFYALTAAGVFLTIRRKKKNNAA